MTIYEFNSMQCDIADFLQEEGWAIMGGYAPGSGQPLMMRKSETEELVQLNPVRIIRRTESMRIIPEKERDYVFHLVYWENLRQRNRGNFFRIQIEPA